MNKNLLKINLLKSYPLKRIRYLKITRSRYIMYIQEKYGIEIKLLSTTYFHIKLPLILLEVMIMNINHKPSMNVDVEMIGQYGKRRFKQN